MQNNWTTSDRFRRFVFQRCRLLLAVNVKKKHTQCKYATLYDTVVKRSLVSNYFSSASKANYICNIYISAIHTTKRRLHGGHWAYGFRLRLRLRLNSNPVNTRVPRVKYQNLFLFGCHAPSWEPSLLGAIDQS